MERRDLEIRLTKRLNKSRDYLRTWQKEHYELAKTLGFTAQEAGVMQNWKEDDIRELARSRGDSKEKEK